MYTESYFPLNINDESFFKKNKNKNGFKNIDLVFSKTPAKKNW